VPHWSTAVCETNDISIHYTRTGGSTPPIVLLHGLTANGNCWTSLARALEGAYDVIMPDARGHGKSSAPDYGYRYEDQANDIIGLIQFLGLSSPILIGHSMGGMTAAVVARQNPKRLRCLILADPTFLSTRAQREVRDSDIADQHRRVLDMSFDEVLADARAKHPGRSPELIEQIARARLQTSLSAFDVLTPPIPDYMQLANVIEVPTLLIISENGIVSRAMAAELQLGNPRFKVEYIPNAGHGIHYDQPERFGIVVKSFLCSIE